MIVRPALLVPARIANVRSAGKRGGLVNEEMTFAPLATNADVMRDSTARVQTALAQSEISLTLHQPRTHDCLRAVPRLLERSDLEPRNKKRRKHEVSGPARLNVRVVAMREGEHVRRTRE